MGSDLDSEVLSAEEARELVATGKAVAVDIRNDEAWESGHITGAIHAPGEELEARLGDLPEDETIIVACEDGDESAKVAERLREKGLQAASIEGGMKAWERDKLPEQPRPDEEFEGPDYTKPPGA